MVLSNRVVVMICMQRIMYKKKCSINIQFFLLNIIQSFVARFSLLAVRFCSEGLFKNVYFNEFAYVCDDATVIRHPFPLQQLFPTRVEFLFINLLHVSLFSK